jgi:hypothetical protein
VTAGRTGLVRLFAIEHDDLLERQASGVGARDRGGERCGSFRYFVSSLADAARVRLRLRLETCQVFFVVRTGDIGDRSNREHG